MFNVNREVREEAEVSKTRLKALGGSGVPDLLAPKV
jgi:hypothetical protein